MKFPLFLRIAGYSILALTALTAILLAIVFVLLVQMWNALPDTESLRDYYKPRLTNELGENRRVFVKIGDVPDKLKKAVLAVEDEYFYDHGIIGSGPGRRALGISTITMQVARNFSWAQNRPIRRHFDEILMAFKIEHGLSKDQILEIYINQTFLGKRAYGFGSAAQTYFGRSLPELNLAQTAMLAGLPKGPSIFNPIDHPKRAKYRQRSVLKRMREIGFINEDEYQHALEEAVETVSGSEAHDPTIP